MNKIFWAVIIAGLGSQLLKIILLLVKYKQNFHWKDIFITGGMPSSHSALVSSLVIIIYLLEGFSTAFFISAVLTAIIIRDALGVRRTVGEEGRMIHEIIKKTGLKVKEYHYSLGHKPKEVLVGVLFGVLVALVVYYV